MERIDFVLFQDSFFHGLLEEARAVFREMGDVIKHLIERSSGFNGTLADDVDGVFRAGQSDIEQADVFIVGWIFFFLLRIG